MKEPRPHKMMLDSSRSYDKWERGGRERDRERAAVARAQQSSAVQQSAQQEPDANCLFRAPVRTTGHDRTSQQIQSKLGDYSVAMALIEHPGDSIGICNEPPSPAPALSRSSSEFKKPHHGSSMVNGRYPHHSYRSLHNKQTTNEATGVPASTHPRPAPHRIPNGTHQQNSVDTSVPQIENIFKEMKLPSVLTNIAATPRKEPDSKFEFNEILNKVQKNTEWNTSTPAKPPPPPISTFMGLDDRVSTTRESTSPDLLDKDLAPSESEDEPVTGMAKLLSPLSTASTSASESSQSESESESSSASGGAAAQSAQAAPTASAPTTATAPLAPDASLASWSLSNFAPPPPPQPPADPHVDADAALAELGRKPQSPVSSLSESSTGARSPCGAPRPGKRGRPRKEDARPRKMARHDTERARKPRGRPRKITPHSSSRSASCESDAEPRVQPPASQDKKIDIFRKVFTTTKPKDGLGKGGAKGGKGGKGKAQVIVEASAAESGADDEHDRRLRDERRRIESPRCKTTSESKSSDFESPRRPKIDLESPRRPRLDVESPRVTKIDESPRRPRLDVESPRVTKMDVDSSRRPRLDVESPRRTKIEFESPRRTKLEVESPRLSPRRLKIEAESPRRAKEAPCSPMKTKPDADSRTRVRILLSRLRPETVARITGAPPPNVPEYFSYLTPEPPEPPEPEKLDHAHYLKKAMSLRAKADDEAGPLARVVLYLESVLCLVMTGRVLEQEYDTKKAFTMYRETIEFIKSIHSMPSRYRASPHSTFTKLDILSLRVQALLYLRMFKMYKGEIKEYDKLIKEYEANMSPETDPAASSAGSGSSSGYGSSHSVPARAHHALLQVTKYYRFLYVAHELWEKADNICRHRSNIDLFLTVDRVVGQLTLFSSFRHLVAYVTYAISIIKTEATE